VAVTDDDLGLDPAATALYHSADAALILSPTRGVVWASPATENVLGLTSSELLGAFATDVIHPDHVAVAIHHRQVALKNGRSGPEEIQGRHGSSGYRWYTAEWWSARSGNGSEPALVIMHLRDAEEVRNARSAVLRSEARLLRLHRTSVDITMIIDQSGSTTYLSPSVERILGWEPQHVLSSDPFDLVHPDDRQRVTQLRETLLQIDQSTYVGEVRVLHLDGRYRWMEINAVNLLADPVINGAVVHLHDITDRRHAEDQLIRATLEDPLTGLASYALMRDRLTLALTRHELADSVTVAAAVFDLDGFASLNDALGHQSGDVVLKQAADRLRQSKGHSVTVARLAGDEFALCFELTAGPHEAAERVEVIRELLCEPYMIDGREHRLTCSAGLAIAGPASDAESLLRDAGAAVHHAKGQGRNRTEVFDAAVRSAMLNQVNLLADLDRAITGDEFFLEFQPAFDTTTGLISGAEALVRWMHPVRGPLPPAAFVAAAERSDRIVLLGQWVARAAVAATAALGASHSALLPVMWINVAAPQLARADFAADLLDTIERAGLDPHRFGIEVTESVLIHSSNVAQDQLKSLRRNGCQLGIDDFGTGYSSLTYLHQFEVDVIKVDRSFVAGIGIDSRADSIVAAVTGMAHALGLRVVAEGVESSEQLERLEQLGCTDVSGFGLVRPLRFSELEGTLGRSLADVRPRHGHEPSVH